jgi:hypothetical protein
MLPLAEALCCRLFISAYYVLLSPWHDTYRQATSCLEATLCCTLPVRPQRCTATMANDNYSSRTYDYIYICCQTVAPFAWQDTCLVSLMPRRTDQPNSGITALHARRRRVFCRSALHIGCITSGDRGPDGAARIEAYEPATGRPICTFVRRLCWNQ